MTYIAGVDIGNSTTEVCIGEVGGAQVHFLSSASCKTTGTKGTIANVHGIRAALKEAMGKIGMGTEALSLIRLNEAAPVIGPIHLLANCALRLDHGCLGSLLRTSSCTKSRWC